MPEFRCDYLLDVDVLGHLQFRPDSNILLEGIIEGIRVGKVKTVRQISSGEIKRFPDVQSVLQPYKPQFELPAEMHFHAELKALMDLIPKLAPKLHQQFGSNNPDPADPWLIGIARLHGFTLVTDENRNAPTRIPMACDHPQLKCRCINGPEFFWETGIVQGDFDPHEIRVHDFYGLP